MVDLSLGGEYQEAVRLVAASRPRDARDICYRILDTFPRHVSTYAVLGQACLRLGNRPGAVNLFLRVLSADPERLEPYVGLAEVYERRREYDEALWYLERAFELAPGDGSVREALVRVREAVTGAAVERLELTQGALARLYLRGRFFAKAAQELRALLEQDPDRVDLRVALAEALWRNRERARAESVCQALLVDLPNCLKANLLLGYMWLRTPKEDEGRALLARAQALDPDNEMAQRLFGRRSPLPLRVSRLPLRDEDAPPLDLSYLWVDDGERPPDKPHPSAGAPSQQGPTDSEGDLTEEHGEDEAKAASEDVQQPPPRRPIIVARGRRPARAADRRRPPPGDALPSAQGTAEEEEPSPMSLLDVQKEYVAEHPDDAPARLDLARLYRDGGSLSDALEQYRWLVENEYSLLDQTIADLQFLNRLYPRTEELERLLADARSRASHHPSS